MIEEQKHPINKFISLITLLLCTAGIIFLIVTFIPSLSPSIVKFRRDNLLAAYAKPEKFRMPQPSSLPRHRLINYTDERLNDLINLLPSQTVTLTKFENCTLNVSTGAKINSSIIQNSTMNISGLNIHLENVILINTKITIDNDSIANISNSTIQDSLNRIYLSRAQLTVDKTLFINNRSESIFYVDGNALLIVRNSEFKSNDGIIFLSHNQKYIDLDGNESSLVPQFIIEHNLIEDNFHLPIYLADLDQFGTRITNNIFRGGVLPYITIKDSDRPYVVISQNYFEDQGIFIENSNHIILWANKFNSIQDYAVQAINSNLIAFQYNIFSDIGDTAIFTKNTPQIELVHNTFGEVGERIVRK